jgi:type VI protein secretion system component Hcp
MAAKAKKSVKKSAKMSRGKKMGAVKPLAEISFSYGKIQQTYTTQKPDGTP